MFCGTASFKDGGADTRAPERKEPKAPAKAGKKKGGRKENPYASRGLDKFSTVMAELESQREKILRRVGPAVDGDRVLVRFVQSEAKDWVPVVVKLPPEEQPAAAGSKKRRPAATPPASKPSTPATSEPTSPREDAAKPAAATAAPAPEKRIKAAVESWSWGKKVRPCHYMPFVALLLLLSLVAFGRVFAICCASVWWYLVPVLSGADGGDECRSVTTRAMGMIAKDLGRKCSDKKVGEKLAVAAAPLLPSHGKKSSSGDHEVISPRRHAAHRNKG